MVLGRTLGVVLPAIWHRTIRAQNHETFALYGFEELRETQAIDGEMCYHIYGEVCCSLGSGAS